MIIGLSGKALSGKDTTADYLISHYHFDEKVGFAYNLKLMVMDVFSLSFREVSEQDFKCKRFSDPVIVDKFHIDGIIDWMRRTHLVYFSDYDLFVGKVLNTPREILQFVGTDIIRFVCSSYHSDIVKNKFSSGKDIVISDIRFLNEAYLVKDFNGFLVRLTRDVEMVGGKTGHQSEVSMDDFKNWDYILNNNGSLKGLYSQIDSMMFSIQR
jgi:hypothetical protein